MTVMTVKLKINSKRFPITQECLQIVPRGYVGKENQLDEELRSHVEKIDEGRSLRMIGKCTPTAKKVQEEDQERTWCTHPAPIRLQIH